MLSKIRSLLKRKPIETKASVDDFWTRDDVPQRGGHLPRTGYPYEHDVQHGLDSNVVMAPVGWVMRTFTEATPIVESRTKGRWQRVFDHPVEILLDKPNMWYDGDAMHKAMIISYLLDGNAYILKIRNTIGEVIQLWYLPHWMVKPVWKQDSQTFIEFYHYTPIMGGRPIKVPVRDMIHIRFGLDPRNPRLGYSPLRPLLREIFTDEEASNFSASVLRNQGFPGVVISPKEGTSQTKDQATKLKDDYTRNFSHDRRGEPFVTSRAVDVNTFGFNPQQINLSALRDITEERVCAMLGLPAAVAGFGAGMQQVKVGATMRELVRLARVNVINPTARTFGRVFTCQLIPDFVSQTRRFRVRYDMTDVSVFQEDEDAKEARILARVAGGVLTVADAQEELGQEADESQDVYIRGSTIVKKGEEPSTPPPPTSNRIAGVQDVPINGNGTQE